MNTPTTHTTAQIAAVLGVNSSETRAKLVKANLSPLNEYVTAAGRRFSVWSDDAMTLATAWANAKTARKAARKAKLASAKLRKVLKVAQVPVAAPVAAPAAPDLSIPLLNQVLARLAEMQNDIRALSARVPRQTILGPAFDAPARFTLGGGAVKATAVGFPLPESLSLHDDVRA